MILHWIGDFIFQSRYEANNKHKELDALLSHTVNYSLIYLALIPILGIIDVVLFIMITLLFHTVQDFFTSKLNSFLYSSRTLYLKLNYKEDANRFEHMFWISIGLDQLLHFIQLYLTYQLLT